MKTTDRILAEARIFRPGARMVFDNEGQDASCLAMRFSAEDFPQALIRRGATLWCVLIVPGEEPDSFRADYDTAFWVIAPLPAGEALKSLVERWQTEQVFHRPQKLGMRRVTGLAAGREGGPA